MNHVCPNVRHENITLWSSSCRLKFIHSQFPLPMALNSVFSFIKMSDRDLKFVYLFCQTDTFLFVIETKFVSVGTTCKYVINWLNLLLFLIPTHAQQLVIIQWMDSCIPKEEEETPIRKCKHPFSRSEHLQNVEH